VALVAVLIVLVLIYSVSSGLWGVVVTDMIEFVVAMGGALLLAVIAWSEVGGLEGLRTGLAEHSPQGIAALDFFPEVSPRDMGGLALAVYLGVLWWANGGIDGSGKRAQRFLACKNEAHAVGSGVWNIAVQWILRSWPWYVTALASIVLYPDLVDHEAAYPRMMADLLPVGLKGLMVAAFLAAFMSTVDTHLNLSSSYFVNDLYKRFFRPDESDAHYVRVARFSLIGLAVVVGGVALLLPSVLYALKLKMELIAGVGLVLVLRWFWWRINAWSELSALATSIATATALQFSSLNGPEEFPVRILIILGISSVVWIAVTFATSPEPPEHLERFYRRVFPSRRGWGPIAERAPEVQPGIGRHVWLQAVLCGVFAFCGMFGVGRVLLGDPVQGGLLLIIAAVSCVALLWIAFIRKPGEEASA
jgi:Na+/proline symporter